jgi:hypothetical protein
MSAFMRLSFYVYGFGIVRVAWDMEFVLFVFEFVVCVSNSVFFLI